MALVCPGMICVQLVLGESLEQEQVREQQMGHGLAGMPPGELRELVKGYCSEGSRQLRELWGGVADKPEGLQLSRGTGWRKGLLGTS